MAIRLENTVDRYRRLPVSDVPSNQPYQTNDDSKEEASRREKARLDFLSPGSAEDWPSVEFPRLDIDQLLADRSRLRNLIDDIEYAPEDTPGNSQDAVYDALTQKLAEVERHISICRMLGQHSVHVAWLDEKPTVRLIADFRESATRQNLEIFGYPEEARFNWLLQQERELAERRLDDSNPVIRDAAAEYLSRTANVDGYPSDPPVELDPKTLEQLKQDLFDIFPGLEEFCNQDFPDIIPVEESLPYFNQMRDILNLPLDTYEAYFTQRRACEETPRGVSVGLKRSAPFTPRDIIRLAFHEWAHVLRRHNAHLQQDPAKQLPTPTSLAFEEALCVLTERALVNESYVSGVNYYKAVGLQIGLDRTQDSHDLGSMRSFRETLDIMTLGEVLRQDATDEEAIAKIRTHLYNQVMRTSRGLAVDARDLSYHVGDQKAKKAYTDIQDLPKSERQATLKWYFSAQFDPTDSGTKQIFAK